MMAELDLFLRREPVPDGRAVDRDETVVDLLGILGVEVDRPVDTRGGIPLLLLALVIEREQLGALVLVLPGEHGLGLAVERPAGLLHRELVAVHGAHWVASCARFYPICVVRGPGGPVIARTCCHEKSTDAQEVQEARGSGSPPHG